MQLESDLVAHGASTVATLAGCPPPQALGHIAFLRAWAVSRATDEAPPDGWIAGEAAGRLVEAAAHWNGEKGALLQALSDAGQVAVEAGGVRILHLEPYRTAWERNAKAKARMANIRERSANTRVPDANDGVSDRERDAKFGGQTQTQTQTQKEAEAFAGSAGASPQAPLFEEPPKPEAKPKKPKPEPTGDPRHTPLVEALCAPEFRYAFRGGHDAKAVKYLLRLADSIPWTAGDAAPAEIVRRWRICRAWVGFPSSPHLAAFAANWNAYADPQGAAKAGPPGAIPAHLMRKAETHREALLALPEGDVPIPD